MSAPPDKARTQRVARLVSTLGTRVDNPQATLEALLSEALAGAPHPDLWEQLHAAAARDGIEEALSAAYKKVTSTQRLGRLAPAEQAVVLMHAADYAQGVQGDWSAAEELLERVLRIAPGHADAFHRLERRLEAVGDPRRALGIYSLAAASPPVPPSTLATMAVHKIVMLGAESPLAEDTCKRLVALAAATPRLLSALDAHCKLTKRPALACALFEEALADPALDAGTRVEHRRRLVDLYASEPTLLASALPHLEALLAADPADAAVRKVAERLLSVREVASRAAALLQTARRNSQPPGRSQPPSAAPPARSQPPPVRSQPPSAAPPVASRPPADTERDPEE